MTHAALSPLIGPEFDPFLSAIIGEDRNGTTLSVLSALARLDVDPWAEARSLARMSRKAAIARMTALIDALPRDPSDAVPSQNRAADLVALLPNGAPPSGKASESGRRASGFGGFGQRRIVLACCAFASMMLVVYAISTLLSPRSETGANPPAPRAADAVMTMPHKTGP